MLRLVSLAASAVRRRLCLALCAVNFAAVCAGAVAAEGESVTMTLPQAQAMTQQALDAGRPDLAFTLSEGLLAADHRNGQAHYFQALALNSLRQPRGARAAANRAFRFAQTDIQKYQAAQLAAQLAYVDDSFTSSQFWLRRAVHFAPNEEVRQQSVLAFRKVRSDNPLSFRLRFSVVPSDNVNNGSNSPYNIIEGSPLVGSLSPSAQAIEGIVARLSVQGSYRILDTDTYQTRITGLASRKHVEFKDPVAGISASDLSDNRLQLGVNHRWGAGSTGWWQAEINAGRQWYGGDPLYDFVGVGFGRVQRLSDRVRLTVGVGVEEQEDEAPPLADATVYSAHAALSYVFDGGSVLRGSVHVRDVDSNGRNRQSTQWYSVASYTLGQKIGPAVLTASLGHSTLDYDTYSVLLPVPGGRLDESWFGGVSAVFKDYSYMGFVPTLSLNAEKSRSNISRFDVDQTSVSFGIASEF